MIMLLRKLSTIRDQIHEKRKDTRAVRVENILSRLLPDYQEPKSCKTESKILRYSILDFQGFIPKSNFVPDESIVSVYEIYHTRNCTQGSRQRV